MIAYPDCVLYKSRVLVCIRIGNCRTETLEIVVWDLVRISPQGREFQTGFHGREGKGVYLDGIENVFAAAERWKKIVDPGEQRIGTELPRIPSTFHTQGFGQVKAVLTGLARKDRGTSETFDEVRNFGQRVGAVGAR